MRRVLKRLIIEKLKFSSKKFLMKDEDSRWSKKIIPKIISDYGTLNELTFRFWVKKKNITWNNF